MLFNSYQFLLFFPVVTALYFLLPHRWRWLWLLLASSLFYMAFVPAYLLILAFTIVIDYFAGIKIESSVGAKRKLFLICSLVANIGVLAFFKYYNFFVDNINFCSSAVGCASLAQKLQIVLPIGLSFHTFQAMAYTIEVYRGKQIAERNFGIYSLYVMFYPQLVAGPIERPQNLIHQFYERHRLSYENLAQGLRQMLWGFYKKMVVADRLAPLVDAVYSHPTEYSAVILLLATYCFAIQIYCDFSGYSDIAIGAAKTMGFDLMVNFRRPYFASNIQEFWRRWHISLSTWFKDYLYVPLGGNHRSELRTSLNILIVFLVSGLWHGASWTYVIWGALHGIFIVLTRPVLTALKKADLAPTLRKVLAISGTVITFNFVCLTWIFFRSPDLMTCRIVISKILQEASEFLLAPSLMSHTIPAMDGLDASLSALFVVLLFAVEVLAERRDVLSAQSKLPLLTRWILYYSVAMLIVLFSGARPQQFIYFQF